MLSRPSPPKNCTITLPDSDFRLVIAAIYEAQHHVLAFSERRTDERLSQIVQAMHFALVYGHADGTNSRR